MQEGDETPTVTDAVPCDIPQTFSEETYAWLSTGQPGINGGGVALAHAHAKA